MRKNLQKIKDYLVSVGYNSKQIYLGKTYDVINDNKFKSGDIVITSFNGYTEHLLCGSPIITGYVNVLYKGSEFSAEDSQAMDNLFVALSNMRYAKQFYTDGLIACTVSQPFMEFTINERDNIFYYATMTLKYTI